MAEGRFDFETNIEEIAARISAGMERISGEVQRSARTGVTGGGGIGTLSENRLQGSQPIPTDFNQRLVKMVNERIELQRKTLAEALDPTKLTQVRAEGGNVRQHIETVMSDVTRRMNASVQTGLDDMLQSLTPLSRLALIRQTDENGIPVISRFLSEAHQQIVASVESMVATIRSQLTTSLKRGLPRTLSLPQNGTLQGNDYNLQNIEAARVGSLFPEGEVADSIRLREYAQAKKAVDQQVAASARETKEQIKAAAREAADAEVASAKRVAAQVRESRAEEVQAAKDAKDAERQAAQIEADVEEKIAAARFARFKRDAEQQRSQLQPIGTSTKYFTGADDSIYMATARRYQGEIANGFVRIDNDANETLNYLKAVNLQLRAAESQAKETAAAVREAAPPRSVSEAFLTGAFGRGFNAGGKIDLSRQAIVANLAQTAGTAARYSLAYGGLYQLTRAIQGVIAEFVDFQDSATDYQVALGANNEVTSSFTSNLEELSRVVGRTSVPRSTQRHAVFEPSTPKPTPPRQPWTGLATRPPRRHRSSPWSPTRR